MAPEQLKGAPATMATDIYALGLVLFEIFTGKRVHEAQTFAELRALHDTSRVTTPTSIVPISILLLSASSFAASRSIFKSGRRRRSGLPPRCREAVRSRRHLPAA